MRLDVAAFAVRNWQFTLVAFGLLVLLGVNALVSTPRSEDPHFPVPTIIVRTVLPGAEPAEMEQLVADPIEDALDVPVRFVGVGEGIGDLLPFDPDAFVAALFA